MILLHHINHTLWYGYYTMNIYFLSGLLINLIINLLSINYCIESTTVTTGSCFAKRLNSGNCIGLMEESISQLECCKQLPSTCKGYVCPEGHYCRMINNEPKCKCRLQCNTADYLTGPLCTTNLRRFHNQCHLKQARCKLPKESLEVIPCPDEGLRCSDLSILSEKNFNLNSLFKTLYNDYEEGKDVSSLPSSTSSISTTNTVLPSSSSSTTDNQDYTNNLDDIIIMNRRTSTDLNTYISNIDESIFDEKTIYSNDELSKELICNTNEYCLLRQFDGRPSCEYWSEQSWKTLNNCPESTFHEPICSTNNQTFYNSCDLKLAGLKNQLEVRIAYKGECRSKATCSNIQCPRAEMRCSPHHLTGQPICMDCAKLPLDCNASFRNGQETLTSASSSSSSSTGILNKRKTQVFGDPVWKTPVQTYGWPVVCGSNGKTYRNTCFLHVVNCLSDKFVELRKPEFCSGK
uniref:Kazal-like domain-containing protein n=1 Tax=Schistosoma haematobium TaxID=6185 RepID=A0A094ZMT5_SCHHA